MTYLIILIPSFLLIHIYYSGFDPFHETQKGLADLLESESKAAEAQQKQVINNELCICNGGLQYKVSS